jgi:hypothetical protein
MPPHCDSIDGPVVKAAIRALDEGSVVDSTISPSCPLFLSPHSWLSCSR